MVICACSCAGAPPISHPSKSEGSDMAATSIHIEPTSSIRGERGQYYRVHYQGAVLIDETTNPEVEGCRTLLARGVTGCLEVWRPGKAYPDMLVRDIAKAAEWTVEENEEHGPRFVRYRPRPADLSQKAISPSAGIAPAAVLGLGATTLPRKDIEPAE